MVDIVIPERLIDVMNDGNLIIFTGAGLSKKVGLPTWTELVKNILDELPKTDEAIKSYLSLLNIGKFTPLQVLSLIENEYKQEIYKSLINQLKFSDNIDLSTHKKIFKISPKVITTNYDKLLEVSAPASIPFIPYNSTFKVSLLDELSQYIFKIHGCIEYTDSCILFESDYKNHYGTLKASNFELQKIFKEKTILFIGFSLSDPFINDLFQFVRNIYQKFTHKHYIVTDKPKDYESFEFITPIALKSYDDLDSCLDQLINAKSSSVATNNILNDNSQNLKVVSEKPDVKILYADPIDKKYNHNFSSYIQQFLNLDINVESMYLSLKNLQTIGECDYVFIFTQIIKNQFVIEDEYLKSKLIKVEDLKEYTSNNIKAIFFFTQESSHS